MVELYTERTTKERKPTLSKKRVDNSKRYRCLVSGCNPLLIDKDAADKHKGSTGHRVAKWPVRSTEGEKKAKERNKNGYYKKYNKNSRSSYRANTLVFDDDDNRDCVSCGTQLEFEYPSHWKYCLHCAKFVGLVDEDFDFGYYSLVHPFSTEGIGQA